MPRLEVQITGVPQLECVEIVLILHRMGNKKYVSNCSLGSGAGNGNAFQIVHLVQVRVTGNAFQIVHLL